MSFGIALVRSDSYRILNAPGSFIFYDNITKLQHKFAQQAFMEQQKYRGKISFINYEKQFATIEYSDNNKQKAVNCKTNATGNGKKPRQYRLGDAVSFRHQTDGL